MLSYEEQNDINYMSFFAYHKQLNIFKNITKNINMLNNIEKSILVTICKICPKGYKVVEFIEIQQSLSMNCELDEIKKCISNLDRNGYVTVKYYDNNVVCLMILVTARQLLEKIENEIQEKQYAKKFLIRLHISIFFIVFLASFLASIISKYLGF